MATLRVIDISSHQGNINQKVIDFDAVIIKATEGKTYINTHCDSEFQEAYKLGKKLGVYHFARNTNNTAEEEANFFIGQTKGYVGKAIPVLDWEDSDTSDVAWALKWLQIVEKAYGCKPMIYMSESVVNRYDWSKVANGNYGLWCAKYRDTIPDYNWDMASAGSAPSVKYWKTIALWQWTSVGRLNGHNGNLDCSVFYGDAAAWDKYVGKGGSGQTTKPSASKPGNSDSATGKSVNYKVKINTESGVNMRSSAKVTKTNKVYSIPNGETVTITKESGKWGYTSYKGYKGWISLEYTKKVASGSGTSGSSKPSYKTGKTYTLQVELKVRTGAGTNYRVKKRSELTADGRKHDKDGDACLDKGTKVTCQQVKNVGSDIWIKCPSGWIAGYYQGKVYIK